MPRKTDSRVLPFSAEQLFELVADVEKYPEFLPWCRGAHVYGHEEWGFYGDLDIGFKNFRETYTSRVHLDRPREVRAEYVRGPLRHLNNRWRFEDLGEGRCRVELELDFAFRNPLLNALIGGLMQEAFSKMVGAFEARARQVYGRMPS